METELGYGSVKTYESAFAQKYHSETHLFPIIAGSHFDAIVDARGVLEYRQEFHKKF